MRVGGLGYLLGDEGSGFELGQRGIRAALRSVDGTGPETGLLLALRECYGLENPMDILPLVYKSPSCVETIARFAVWVLDLGFKGDSLAKGIVQDAIGSLLNMTFTLACKLNLTRPFALATSGGVFQNRTFLDAFLNTLKSRMPQAKPITPRHSPQMAAALLALEAIGIRY
jgi:N-acetylglucosamine kinase-like BadF-type ATPase